MHHRCGCTPTFRVSTEGKQARQAHLDHMANLSSLWEVVSCEWAVILPGNRVIAANYLVEEYGAPVGTHVTVGGAGFPATDGDFGHRQYAD